MLGDVTTHQEPKSYYKGAVKHLGWKKSTQNEIQALEDDDNLTTEFLPPEKHALGTQWVCRNKFSCDGTLEHQKSR